MGWSRGGDKPFAGSSARFAPGQEPGRPPRPGGGEGGGRPGRRPVPVRRLVVTNAALLLLLAGSLAWVAATADRQGRQRAGTATTGPATSPSTVRSPATTAGRLAVDGADPRRASCTDDGVTVDSRALALPGRVAAGTVALRYSARCQAAWAEFAPAPRSTGPRDATITVTLSRPADRRDLSLTVVYPYRPARSEVLSTVPGCVVARGRLGAAAARDGEGPVVADTRCEQGSATS